MAPGSCSRGARAGLGTAGYQICHRPADTVVQARGHEVKHVVVCGHQVEPATLCPVAHDIVAAPLPPFTY
jgi:hypothetical protein